MPYTLRGRIFLKPTRECFLSCPSEYVKNLLSELGAATSGNFLYVVIWQLQNTGILILFYFIKFVSHSQNIHCHTWRCKREVELCLIGILLTTYSKTHVWCASCLICKHHHRPPRASPRHFATWGEAPNGTSLKSSDIVSNQSLGKCRKGEECHQSQESHVKRDYKMQQHRGSPSPQNTKTVYKTH